MYCNEYGAFDFTEPCASGILNAALMSKILALLKTPIGITAIILAGGGIWWAGSAFLGKNSTDYETATVRRQDITQIVSVTGKVIPAEDVSLAPEKGGKVTEIRVAVGDHVEKGQILLSTNNADLFAQLREAEANLQIEKIRLGTSREKSAVDLSNARDALIDKIRDGFTKADDAVRNKADQLFEDSSSFGAVIQGYKFTTTDYSARSELNTKRRQAEKILNDWEAANQTIGTLNNIADAAADAEENLLFIEEFLNDLSAVVNAFPNGDATYSSIASGLRADIAAARTSVSTALTNLKTAKQNYLATEANVKAGASFENTLIQEEKVKNAQAQVDAIRAQIEQTLVRAPFSGTVTKVDVSLGEIVSANTPAVSVISDGKLQAEAFVPEVDIADLRIGQLAEITLDAYGQDTKFRASLIAIDPAETIIEGVATYRVKLIFSEGDERIKPGMTANIDIITGESKSALSVPQRAIIEKDGRAFVRVLKGTTVQEVEVQTGLRSPLGDAEVLSGLNEGDTIVVFVRE